MFDMLLESGHRPSLVPSWGKGVAVALHVLIVATLLRAPASPATVYTEGYLLPPLEPAAEGEHAAPRAPVIGPVLPGPLSLPAPEFPAGIWKPLETPVTISGGGPTPVEGPQLQPDSGVYLPFLVQEAPELLSAPTPLYPPLLRTAGVQGRVMVAAVVDTLGQAENGSVRIVRSDNPGFDVAALATIQAARFRPGRMLGRAVRVLVQVPVDFRLK